MFINSASGNVITKLIFKKFRLCLLLYFLPSLWFTIHIYLFLCRQTLNNQQLLGRCTTLYVRAFHATHSHACTSAELFSYADQLVFLLSLEHERVMDKRFFPSDILYELGLPWLALSGSRLSLYCL